MKQISLLHWFRFDMGKVQVSLWKNPQGTPAPLQEYMRSTWRM